MQTWSKSECSMEERKWAWMSQEPRKNLDSTTYYLWYLFIHSLTHSFTQWANPPLLSTYLVDHWDSSGAERDMEVALMEQGRQTLITERCQITVREGRHTYKHHIQYEKSDFGRISGRSPEEGMSWYWGVSYLRLAYCCRQREQQGQRTHRGRKKGPGAEESQWVGSLAPRWSITRRLARPIPFYISATIFMRG